MKQTTSPTIAIITYNAFYDHEPGITELFDTSVLLLPYTFNPSQKDEDKHPKNVQPEDSNWVTLLRYQDSLKHIIIFAGKESSGALEIIGLICETFADQKGKLYFMLCDHDERNKTILLESYKITHEHIIYFRDGHKKCEEDFALAGLAFKFAKK